VPDTVQPHAETVLRVLADGAAAAARGARLDDALRQLLDLAVTVSEATRAAILVQDPEHAELEVAVSIGYGDLSLDGLVAAAGGEDTFSEAASRPAGRVDLPLAGGTGTDSGALVTLLPLITGHDGIDRIVGMLVLERAGLALEDHARTTLYAIADLAAAAVDRVQVRSLAVERADWFERIASSDPLTGLANRHVLVRVLEHELSRAGRQASEVSLAVFDVDAFRAVNDASGRDVGDRILQEVAAAIAGSVRMVDTVARLGGDEFVVVAPGAGGLIVARRVMNAIGRLSEVLGRTVSVSAGVARFPIHGATADELLEAAVEANEAAKATGAGGLMEATAAPSA
jgi:diguanylate cyclase (GGDEF)-like protein